MQGLIHLNVIKSLLSTQSLAVRAWQKDLHLYTNVYMHVTTLNIIFEVYLYFKVLLPFPCLWMLAMDIVIVVLTPGLRQHHLVHVNEVPIIQLYKQWNFLVNSRSLSQVH